MDLSNTKVFVLDEADEMLSLGFWPDMKEIASFLPRKRQSHLFSATMPERVRSLSRFFLNEPEDVTIEVDGGSPQKIEHYYYMCAASEKEATLTRIMQYEDPDSAIIFCNTKADVRFITAYLQKRGFNIDQISGDLPQSAREKAIAKIKKGKLRFLVATDVAARGIDISDLAYVVNYTTSDSPEVYVHRTGRTGRAGKSGVAISLISGLDIGNFKFMQTVNKIAIKEKKVPTERAVARRAEKRQKEDAAENERKEQEAELDTLRERSGEDLASLPTEEAEARVGRMKTFVDQLAKDEEGLTELARFAAAYLVARPAKAGPDPVEAAEEDSPTVEDRETERAREDSERGDGEDGDRGRRRSRSGRGRSSGGGGSRDSGRRRR
jgi:ATP-dependent RNA helicase DeaD